MQLMPSIKHPPAIDISHWIDVPDFNALEPKPWLVITKATQGTWLLDAKYGEYAEEIPAAGIRLGAYHFMEPGDEVAQADWFCEIILQVGLRGNEILGCDMEVPGVNLAEIRNFLDRVQLRTGIRPIIYSSQLMLEALYPNNICPEWLKSETLWIAEYPSSPDMTNEIPSWIVPRGLSKSNIGLWQYTDDGIMKGIPGNNIDLNLINPAYAMAIGLTEPSAPTNGGTPMPTIKGRVRTLTNIRSSIPAGTYKDIGDLQGNDLIEADRKQDVNGVWWYHLTNATRNGAPVMTTLGVPVSQTEAWAYGTNIEETTPTPATGLPVLSVTVEGDGYESVTVELKPKA
jgi:GH25 family lysozyme M1 (1,4-beta-N-acetylmuramidase)